MPKYLSINSFGLKKTMGAGVRKFTFALKTSRQHPKALRGVVSRSYRPTISFLRKWLMDSQATSDLFRSYKLY